MSHASPIADGKNRAIVFIQARPGSSVVSTMAKRRAARSGSPAWAITLARSVSTLARSSGLGMVRARDSARSGFPAWAIAVTRPVSAQACRLRGMVRARASASEAVNVPSWSHAGSCRDEQLSCCGEPPARPRRYNSDRALPTRSPLDCCRHLPAGGPGSVQHQLRDLVRVRDQRQVAGVDLNGRGLHAVGQEALKFWRRGAIVPGNGVPGRLGRLPAG